MYIITPYKINNDINILYCILFQVLQGTMHNLVWKGDDMDTCTEGSEVWKEKGERRNAYSFVFVPMCLCMCVGGCVCLFLCVCVCV